MLEEGLVEITYGQTEKIGLPNWSFLSFLASAKTHAKREYNDEVFAWLHDHVNGFLRERVAVVAAQLNIWAGVEGDPAPEWKPPVVPVEGIELVELTFSRTETVGLPEKSSINLLASLKSSAQPEAVNTMFGTIADLVNQQMKEKRDVVLANPRPWTSQG